MKSRFFLMERFSWETWILCMMISSSGGSRRPQTSRQHEFVKDEYHFLNVPEVGISAVPDAFDCTFRCLSNPQCDSVNVAASTGADGKLWCELLSSDIYRDLTEYKVNISAHHFSKKTPCFSSPCQNGGTCSANYEEDTFDCLCKKGFIGTHCEEAVESCKELHDANMLNTSQLVTLRFNSETISVLCQMGNFGCGDGAWTPVMKTNGNKNTFHYDAGYWTNLNSYNLPGGQTGFDTQETKLPTYWNTPFSKICLGMKVGQQLKFIVINKQANSLYSLIADGNYRATSLGRGTWKTLLGSQGSLQRNCNREGFNSVGGHTKTRIGIVSNEGSDGCNSCDSRIGFGSGGGNDDSNTCGNVANWYPDNGDRNTKAMGYIFVQ